MTPGRYIALRRQAAGLSIEEVALAIATEPGRSTVYRADWLRALEADVAAISADVVTGLRKVFAFDRYILVQLIALHAGAEVGAPDICRCCGCSWNDPCLAGATAVGCGWQDATRSLCTACAATAAAAVQPDPAEAR